MWATNKSWIRPALPLVQDDCHGFTSISLGAIGRVPPTDCPHEDRSSTTDIWCHSWLLYGPIISKLWQAFLSMTMRSLFILVSSVTNSASKLLFFFWQIPRASLVKLFCQTKSVFPRGVTDSSSCHFYFLWLLLLGGFPPGYLLWDLHKRWKSPPSCCRSRFHFLLNLGWSTLN